MKVGTWRWSLSFLIISVGLYISLSRLLIFIFLWEGRQLFFSSVAVLRNDVSFLFLSRESCGSSHMAKCHEITFSVLWSSCFTRLEAVSLRAETPFSRISTGLWPRVPLAIIQCQRYRSDESESMQLPVAFSMTPASLSREPSSTESPFPLRRPTNIHY